MKTCPFCEIEKSKIILSNDLTASFYDGFPVSPGHALIIPKRHIVSLFEATEEERALLFELVGGVRALLLKERMPDGFNVGINDGAAAGQTVMHLHIHLIPRYTGDMADPRGGVRWIFADKADYWTARD
jgi:diadenosine tetraphosphate (Ap4A) HIT family hydrolase